MRELNSSDPYELAIIKQHGDGIVVWRQDLPGQLSEASIVAVVAGDDGPDMVCVEAHSNNAQVFTKAESFPLAALEAKIPLREWFYHRLEPRDGNDDELVSREIGGFVHGIWRWGSTGHYTYMGRVQRPGSADKHLVMATVIRDGSDRKVTVGFDAAIPQFVEQVRSLDAGASVRP